MKKTDLLWILLFPAYLLLGSLRHELSTALMAMFEGAKVSELVFWPTWRAGHIWWGYCGIYGETSWLTFAAPYFCDLLFVALCFNLCTSGFITKRWIWLNAIIIGMISPLVNTSYSYWKKFHGWLGDFDAIECDVAPFFVHLYFVVTIIAFACAIAGVFLSRKAPE